MRSSLKTETRLQDMKQSKVIDKHVRARRADARDAEVGRRVRSRRLECRLSQTELADRIGVTFQQVQKYEKGVNRIGAGRLQRISEALEVPITFFFGGAPGAPARETSSNAESIFGFMQTSGSVRIVKAFHKIKSRKARQLLVEMAEELADAAA
jgi:transcriptional regulator with XRE-family HTH domain